MSSPAVPMSSPLVPPLPTTHQIYSYTFPATAHGRVRPWTWTPTRRRLSPDLHVASQSVAHVSLSRSFSFSHFQVRKIHPPSAGPVHSPQILAIRSHHFDHRFYPHNTRRCQEIVYYSRCLPKQKPPMTCLSSLSPNEHESAPNKHLIGHFNEVEKILHQVSLKNPNLLPEIYSLAVPYSGEGGQLEMMENTWKEIVSRGFSVDSATGNAFIINYSIFGSLDEMEVAYGRLKRSRILIEKEAIRAMAFAYIKERKFYALGQFLRDVGLRRRNVGNLLWNLLLLSYAANFKMKSLQREFCAMVEAGFRPDITTFNIRSLAFSRMSLFWDLHLSLDHMKHDAIVPDLVTYGCVVDAYLDRRLGRNLDFALNKMNVTDSARVSTDPLVFEVLGKGDFHLSSEAFIEFKKKKSWTYQKLITTYLRKKYRRNQIFWNY